MNKPGKKKFVLRDAGGDLSKKWFVHYKDDRGKWQKAYQGINEHATKEGRVVAAQELISRLEAAYIPPPANHLQKKQLFEALEARRPELRQHSFSCFETKLKLLFAFLDGREVTPETAKEFLREYQKTRRPATVHEARRSLNFLFERCGMKGWLDGFEPKKGKSDPARYFQAHQAAKLADYLSANDPQLWLHCQFVYYCFLRPRAELRFLKVEDIYFEEQKIMVRSDFFAKGENGHLPAGSKNHKTEFVAIPDAFAPSLERLKDLPPNSYVFHSEKSIYKPIGRNTLGERHTAILRKLGFSSEYKLYSWKHTGAVACVKAGVSLKELQIQLRHHSLDMVDKYLRQLGVADLVKLRASFPAPGEKLAA
jgi:integrase